MIFQIGHLTRYRYSDKVNLGCHLLRMTPRCEARQQLLSYEIVINPEPTRVYDFIDVWGNTTQQLNFAGNTELLEIRLQLEVQTHPDMLLVNTTDTDSLTFPVDYGREKKALLPYLEKIESDELMQEFTNDLRMQCEGSLYTLLELINKRVKHFHQHAIRIEGDAHSPAETLRMKAGVCRDLALLFIAACRHLGIAARFVSGYQKQPASGNRDQRYLHAWTEVYLPGLGWHGYDQTHGSPVVDQHIIMACGALQAHTMPVEGSFSFSGKPPKSTLETEVRISTVNND